MIFAVLDVPLNYGP